MARFADAGWVWEGQGVNLRVAPSIFGVGEGAAYFGLRKAVFMFHPNNELAMEKLSRLDEVICDITKWKFRWPETGGVENWADASLASVVAEAERVSRLSVQFPNITGGLDDDLRGLIRREGIQPSQYADIHAALKSANPALKLWGVVYSTELDSGWEPLQPYIDVVNLWVWDANDLLKLDADLETCRRLFPNKPINMGCYLRDYKNTRPVPMDLLKYQWERVARYLSEGRITGYSIIAAVLIDGQQEQAQWVRDFIAAESR